jgi:hypothetical protein
VWLLAALFLIYAAQLTFHLIPEPVGGLVTRWSPLVIFPAAALLCGVHGFRRGRERAAWLLLGLGLLLWGFGIAYFTILQWDLKVIPTPSPADGFSLAVYPPWYAGLFLLFRARVGAVGWRVAVDGLIGALGMGAIAAAIVFEAVLHNVEGSAAAVITNLAYPVGDLLLLSLVVGVMVVGGRRMVGTFGWIAAGMCAFAVADSIYLYRRHAAGGGLGRVGGPDRRGRLASGFSVGPAGRGTLAVDRGTRRLRARRTRPLDLRPLPTHEPAGPGAGVTLRARRLRSARGDLPRQRPDAVRQPA